MSRLILLSNRVKFPDDKQSGGLAIAVARALKKQGEIWLGWNGEIQEKGEMLTQTQDNITYITRPFSQEQYQHYYCGFANSVLWAFLHDREDLILEQSQDFAIYQQVNEEFARCLLAISQPDDVIWVHDYHFLSVAYYCRKLGMRNRIGFFLHIPFAPPARWQYCPHAEILLSHLSEYDVIGTQTQADKRHCQHTLATLLTHHTPLIESYPIGVDIPYIQQHIESKYQTASTDTGLIKIIAVDRIDYTKGILQRLETFAQFLRRYPHYQGKIQLQQIASPSRLNLSAYSELYQQVTQKVIELQQAFATAMWQPLVYSETVLAQDELMQVFFDSQICWVNSLKDGMNLVAKEYIVAQNPTNAGVLLLSKYAGASEQMREAVLIDPYDDSDTIQGLLTAITMPLAEKQGRYEALMKGLKQQDLLNWQQRFLQDL